LNYYTYTFNNPLIYVDPTGNVPYSYKIADDYYTYFNTRRGLDLYHTGIRAVPIIGNLASRNPKTQEISDKSLLETTKGFVSLVTDYSSQLSYIRYKTAVGDITGLRTLSAIGRVSGYLNWALFAYDIGSFAADKSYVYDQLIDQIAGYYLQSSSREGVEMKYLYVKHRIDELISEETLTYKKGFFGWGNVIDYELDPNIQEQITLELAILDSFRVNTGEERIDMFMATYAREYTDIGFELIDEDIVREWLNNK